MHKANRQVRMSRFLATITENPNDRSGSNSEIITLESLCSGDERKAVLICCLISGVFSSQFGQKETFAVKKEPPVIDGSARSGH